jgi:hypothetical protein
MADRSAAGPSMNGGAGHRRRRPFQRIERVPTPNPNIPPRFVVRHGDVAAVVDEHVDNGVLRGILADLSC